MNHNPQLRIAWLYPDLMSTYGDRGNIIVLKKRCEWRNIKAQVVEISLETPLSTLTTCNLVFMGGAQDRQQKISGDDFIHKKGPVLKKMIEKGTPALFVCAAYQAVGRFYRSYQGDVIKGAGIIDLTTFHPGDQGKRLIGNCVAQILNPTEINGQKIVGFENHGGRTYLGKNVKPFAKVLNGYGNNGEDGYEGAVYQNAIGSYFHGPLLTKNPGVADWLIARSLAVKYGKDIELEPLDETLEKKARKIILNRF